MSCVILIEVKDISGAKIAAESRRFLSMVTPFCDGTVELLALGKRCFRPVPTATRSPYRFGKSPVLWPSGTKVDGECFEIQPVGRDVP